MKRLDLSYFSELEPHDSWDINDSTKTQAYQSCARMYFWEYVLGWRSARPNNHLHFGQCVHEAMEHIILNGYKVDSVLEAMNMFTEQYRKVFPVSTDEIFTPKTPDRFYLMLIQYLKTYITDIQRYKVIYTEIGGTVPISDKHTMAWKMDTVLYDLMIQKYCSLEHKTKGGNFIGSNYPYEFKLNVQLGTYTHVLKCLFPPEQVSEVIINCLNFKKTKAPGFILDRFPLPLSDRQMENWRMNTCQWLDRIDEDFYRLSLHSDSDDRLNCFDMNGRACTDWGRVCIYHDLCTSWNNPLRHLDKMPLDYQIFRWNPLEEKLTKRIEL